MTWRHYLLYQEFEFLTKDLRRATHILYCRIKHYPAFPVINQILNKKQVIKLNSTTRIGFPFTFFSIHGLYRRRMISGFRREVAFGALLTLMWICIPYRRFGTNTWATFRGSRSPGLLKMWNTLRNTQKCAYLIYKRRSQNSFLS